MFMNREGECNWYETTQRQINLLNNTKQQPLLININKNDNKYTIPIGFDVLSMGDMSTTWKYYRLLNKHIFLPLGKVDLHKPSKFEYVEVHNGQIFFQY